MSPVRDFGLLGAMMFWCILVSTWAATSVLAITASMHHPIQYAISRRAGSFPSPDVADLPYLLQHLKATESRFSTTTIHLTSDGNSVRTQKKQHGGQVEIMVPGSSRIGGEGNWFTTFHMGQPVQGFDMDLDMLTGDFLVWSTTSHKGSWFLDFKSSTYTNNAQMRPPFPGCNQPTDIFHTPGLDYSMPIAFAHCRPRKCWIDTLLPSGACLGLAPSLHQTESPHLFSQLLEKNFIEEPLWSIKLLNANTGILTIGHPICKTKDHDYKDDPIKFKAQDDVAGRGSRQHVNGISHRFDWKKDWVWSKLIGPEGWWQVPLHGLWLDGARILQDEEVILDVNTPFIIAPPYAAQIFYASVAQARHLPPPYDQFFTYPCLSPPNIQLQFAADKFPILQDIEDEGSFAPGGRFSLGRVAEASGFCVGGVVEGRFGGHNDGEDAGMHNTWVLGQDLFRNVEIMFDWKEGTVGMKKVDA